MKRLSWLMVVISLVMAGLAQSAPSAATKPNDTQTLWEPYVTIALRNPRHGPVVQKLHELAAQAGEVDALLARVQTHASGGNAQLLTGLIQELDGRVDDALISYESAAKSRPEAWYPDYAAGFLLLRRDEDAPAIEHLLAALARQPDVNDQIEIREALGEAYVRTGELGKAAGMWSSIQEHVSDDAEVMSDLLALLMRLEQWDDAVRIASHLRELHRDEAEPRLRDTMTLGDIEARRDRFTQALAYYTDAMNQADVQQDLRNQVLAKIDALYKGRSDLDGLVKFYEQQLTTDSKDAQVLKRLAGLLADMGQPQSATAMYERAIALAPQDVPLRLAAIKLLVETSQYARAVEHYELLLKADPDNASYLEGLGELYLKAEPGEKGMAHGRVTWERIATLDSTDASRLARVGEVLARHDQRMDASKYFRRAIELELGVPGYRDAYAALLIADHQRAEALIVLRGMVDGDRRSVENLLRLGDSFEKSHFEAEALKAFEDAVALEPRNVETRLAAARAFTRHQRFDEALQQLDEADRLASNSFLEDEVWTERIALLALSGKLREAFEQQVAEIKLHPPAMAKPFIRTAQMAIALDEVASAQESIEHAVEMEPSSIAIHELAATIHVRAGDDSKAIAHLKRLMTLAPANRVDYLQRLARCYVQLGDQSKAMSAARTAMAAGPENRSTRQLVATLNERFSMPKRVATTTSSAASP